MIVSRVERHIIHKSNSYYDLIDNFCFMSKNLYNHANYIVRNEFVKNNRWIRHSELDKILRADVEYPDYRSMPTAQSAQQLLKLLDKNWLSFFKSIKDWSKNKSKYLGKPKLPNYKKKDGRTTLILTNQEVKLKNNILKFPKAFNGFSIEPQFIHRNNFVSFQQVRFIPNSNHIVVELVYNIEIPNETVNDNSRYISIDLGVDNFATITNNFGEIPVILNGRGLKFINQYYNKLIAHYGSISTQHNHKHQTKRMNRITEKRNNKISDYMHKSSHFVIDYAIQHNVSVIVVGYNQEWKQNCDMGKSANQNFTQIPFKQFLDKLQYKAEEAGLKVILVEESYTSGTSFLDNEAPVKDFYNKSRRFCRGLFRSNNRKIINADVNASLQILKKAIPTAFSNGTEGVMVHPVRVNVY